MFKYDFIILYEHRNRELENAVLLAMMLEKKGYKVAIEYRKSVRLLFQSADVILAPFLYDNACIKEFIRQPFRHCKKLINMQYEQVFQIIDEGKPNLLPHECAKYAVHISWGKDMTERYKSVGIAPNKIFELGLISIDLNMSKYRSVFLTKHELSRYLKIPVHHKWLLFISSFSCVGLTQIELKNWETRSAGVKYFSEISYKSQPIILDYFEKLAKKHPELVIIYRPHPHEASSKALYKLANKYKNFKIISNYSIRQWILVSDYISTWCSTSLVDVFFAQKPCAIIRPISFSEEYDYPIFKKQKIISNYRELEDFIKNSNKRYEINSEQISKYYCNDFNANTFEKLRDVCIQIRRSNSYEYNYSDAVYDTPLFLIKLYIYTILLFFAQFIDYSKFVPPKYHEDFQYAYREMRKYKKEISFYRKRFARIVNNE